MALKLGAKHAAPARETADRLKAMRIYDRLGDISAQAGEGSRLADAIRGIEKQQGLLDDLSASTYERTIPTVSDILVIESPIIETNRKLDRIEKQFSQISIIARDSARVATDLQAYAAEFLQKFEKAAEDANQSGSKAIKVGWLALAIAIVVGAGQIFAPTLIRDQEAEALRQTVVDLNAEISTLWAEQGGANERLIEALVNSDQATATVISKALTAIAAQKTKVSELGPSGSRQHIPRLSRSDCTPVVANRAADVLANSGAARQSASALLRGGRAVRPSMTGPSIAR